MQRRRGTPAATPLPAERGSKPKFTFAGKLHNEVQMGEILAKILGAGATIAVVLKVLIMVGNNTVDMSESVGQAQATAVSDAQAAAQ